MFKILGLVLAILYGLPLNVLAANSTAASTFFLNQTETAFSINVANDSSDVFIYFTSPAFSWVAVGMGKEMKGSLMFVMYPSADNKNLTISPRIGTGHTEPSFASDIQLSVLPGTGINNESFVLNAVCHNCRSWKGGSLDVTSQSQPWIYAFGPDNPLQSDKQDAPLRRHREFGHFTMNMQYATGSGGVPAPSAAMAGVNLIDEVADGDRASLAHAVLFAVVVFILWPMNVVLVGFFKAIKLHIVFSVIKLLFIVAGFALGIYVSGEYNRSKSFATPHQIIGFLTLLPIIGLSVLPMLKERAPPNSTAILSPNPANSAAKPKTSKLTLAHTWLTRFTWLMLVLEGGLGLQLSSSPMHTRIIYALISIAVALPMAVVYSCMWRKGRISKEHDDDRDMVLAAYYATQPKQDTPPAYGQGQPGPGQVHYQQAQGQWSEAQTQGHGQGGQNWHNWQQRL